MPHIAKPFPLSVSSSNQDFYFLERMYETCPKAYTELASDSHIFYNKLDNLAMKIGDQLDTRGIYSNTYFGELKWNGLLLSNFYDSVHFSYVETGILLEGIDEKMYKMLSNVKALRIMAEFFTSNEESNFHTHAIAS